MARKIKLEDNFTDSQREIVTNTSFSIYPSKVDLWLEIIFIGLPLVLICVGIHQIIIHGSNGVFLIAIASFTGGLIAALSIPCRYTLTESTLIIQSGFLKEEIKIEKIRDAIPTNNPLSAPALSLQRVEIVLDSGFRLISPVDRDRFIIELKQRIKKEAQFMSKPEPQ